MFASSAALWLLIGCLFLGWLVLSSLMASSCILLLGWLLLTFKPNKTLISETGYLDNPQFLLTVCLGIQIYDSPLSQHSQLGYVWLPAPNCAALIGLTKHPVIPLVIKCFPPKLYLGGQRISLWVASILSMCLSSHTQLINNLRLIFQMPKPKMFSLW